MRKYLFLLLSILVLTSLALVACAPTPTEPPPPTDTPVPTKAPEPTDTPVPTEAPEEGPPDLTGETIRIYGLIDFSGPFAASTAPMAQGTTDIVDYYNAIGGIFGAQIEMVFEDTGGKVDEAVAIYNRFTGEDDNIVMILLFTSADEEALRDRVKEDKIPTMGMAPSTTALYGVEDGWLFTAIPLYPEQLANFMDYVVANWDSIKPAGAGDEIKLAHLSWPGAFGQASLTDESQAYIEALGVEIVANEQYEMSPTADTTTAILNAQAAGANVIWTNTLAHGPAVLLNDLHELGLRDQFVVGGCFLTMDFPTYAFLADPSYGEGFYAAFPYAWWSETDNPAIQTALEIAEKNERGPEALILGRLIVQSGLDVARHAIEQAILDVGFENLNGEAVYNALTQIQDYEVMGGLTTVDFTNGIRASRISQIRQIQGGPGQFVIIQDFTELPDLRPRP